VVEGEYSLKINIYQIIFATILFTKIFILGTIKVI
jgi:hypothetical protein